jgi:hypothetical protein
VKVDVQRCKDVYIQSCAALANSYPSVALASTMKFTLATVAPHYTAVVNTQTMSSQDWSACNTSLLFAWCAMITHTKHLNQKRLHVSTPNAIVSMWNVDAIMTKQV